MTYLFSSKSQRHSFIKHVMIKCLILATLFIHPLSFSCNFDFLLLFLQCSKGLSFIFSIALPFALPISTLNLEPASFHLFYSEFCWSSFFKVKYSVVTVGCYQVLMFNQYFSFYGRFNQKHLVFDF